MFFKPPNCPNRDCRFHRNESGERFFVKKGYFRTEWNRQPVPRYRCKSCGKFFSSHTFRETYRQKKPFLNDEIFRWYASATTQRRMAIVMRINRKTVVRKFLFMAYLARKEHERRVAAGELKTGLVEFDEVETFEHTRLKPLSIAVAIREKTGEIIEAQVATMNCKGPLAKISQFKYGWRQDTREAAREDVLRMVNKCSKANITIRSDAQGYYAPQIKRWVPHAKHEQVNSQRVRQTESLSRRNVDDKMFRMNLTAAKFRHDMSRMARRVWVTTKDRMRLQAHLDLYIAWNNGYTLT